MGKFSFRATIFIAVAICALLLGSLFAVPIYKERFARVEINGVSLLAEVAADPASQIKGLSGRDKISESAAMLFNFNKPDKYAIWMKQMKFPLDIFWIKDGVVVDLVENVPPPEPGVLDSELPIYRPAVSAEFVLETNAGFAQKHNVRIGDAAKIFLKDESSQAQFFSDVSQSLPPGYEYFIETLRQGPPEGKDFTVEKLISENKSYKKYQISYRSDSLKISGVMDVPMVTLPTGGFPVLILSHDPVLPESYSGEDAKLEQDFFASRGYAVIQPDYRGYGLSDPNPAEHYDFETGYTKDVLNLIDALKKANPDTVDANRIGLWGYAGGGLVATKVMVLSPDIKAVVLLAPESAEVKDNFGKLPDTEKKWLQNTFDEQSEAYGEISPLNYFAKVFAPVQIHQGAEDNVTPIGSSEKIYNTLKNNGKKAEFFKYPGAGHDLNSFWTAASQRALQFLDFYVKNSK